MGDGFRYAGIFLLKLFNQFLVKRLFIPHSTPDLGNFISNHCSENFFLVSAGRLASLLNIILLNLIELAAGCHLKQLLPNENVVFRFVLHVSDLCKPV